MALTRKDIATIVDSVKSETADTALTLQSTTEAKLSKGATGQTLLLSDTKKLVINIGGDWYSIALTKM